MPLDELVEMPPELLATYMLAHSDLHTPPDEQIDLDELPPVDDRED